MVNYTNNINNTGFKGLIYGESGHGKTRLLGSAPKPFIISTENGLKSLHMFSIPYENVKTIAELTKIREWLSTKAADAYWTICIDSMTELAKVILHGEKKKATRDPRRAYGEMADQVEEEMRKFRDIVNKHVIIITHQDTEQDETGRRYIGPSFPGKSLVRDAPYIFDFVWQMNKINNPANNQPGYFLRCHPDNQTKCKTRNGEKLNEWENADPATGGGLDYLFNKMMT